MSTPRFSSRNLFDLSQNSTSTVERILADHLVRSGSGRPSPSEVRSWNNSIPVLMRDLQDAGLHDLEVLLEHKLPLSSKRADIILAGMHAQTQTPHYVVVEMKQWSEANSFEDSKTLVNVPGARYSPVLHPSVQVTGYADYLRDFMGIFSSSPESISGISYLHNADSARIQDLQLSNQNTQSPIFSRDTRGSLISFLTRTFAPLPGQGAADHFLQSKIAPSKQLLSLAAKEIQETEQFVLLDEQRVAYELVLANVEKARQADQKTVVLITGGPGSGKSVIALSLLGELARRGHATLHATGSRSFTMTLRKVAGKRSPRTQELFKYFNSFMSTPKNSLEVLIMDEAHRIREKSVNRYTPKALRERSGPQIQELLDVARVPVFLLDEHQVVRPGEMGSVAQIKHEASAREIPVFEVNLATQYRAGGSAEYITWVQRLLGLIPNGPIKWTDEETFTVEIAESPEEMEARLRIKLAEGANARMTAGYCWPWSNPNADRTLVDDIAIGDWHKPWNSKSDRSLGDIPPAPLWASEPGGFEQVGCVYTAQGFEYSWNGVIFGPDLVWRKTANNGDGGWVSRREFNKDPDFRSLKNVSNEEFDALVRNVYKVLLTRGLQGTILYSSDPETQSFLGTLINQEAP